MPRLTILSKSQEIHNLCDGSNKTALPASEEDLRLYALRDLNVSTSTHEERFDRIVRLAATHFRMPVCKISIIDHDRNWYKASIGTQEEECARSSSICNYAIRSDEPLIVPDLSRDTRFSALPQVTGGQKFRFYAGAPVILDNGARVGSLCLMDVIPHPHISREDIQFLVDLSGIVSRELMLQQNSAQKIQELIDYDPLTRLHSRMFIQSRMQAAIVQAQQAKSLMAALCIDIDDFAAINDIHGHFFGDQFIQAFSARIADLATPNLIPGRLSGDKFLLIATGIRFQSELEKISSSILNHLSKPLQIEDALLQSSCSIGVAMGPPDDGKAITLQKYADCALHDAKSNGKNSIRFFTHRHYQAAMTRKQLAEDLKSANLDQELVLNYQPFMDLETNKVVGYEALLRWQHPIRGLLFPDVFIQLAEKTGMIGVIGEWVLNRACKDAAQWQGNQFVSVNLSPSQFRSQDIVEQIKRALRTSGLDPHQLEVEITENALISDFELVNSKLRDLSTLGVSIALDDFGTGYSSLSYLAALKFDKIKIDKFFIDRIDTDSKIRKIILMIARLAKSIDTTIVAEGVEESFQHDIVKEIGCNVGQGYLYGKPMPLDSSKASILAVEAQA
ncbi:GGDEF and EAL domain-containing protein [uncultured Cohaesibacter sp.]|uniref:putative bifunctional diguanylate cyclase/phosphodiesterase n=1 Tax=uncultured Cohaesibacter sp. TaxID=1002546 RepID=UPI0029C82F3D|nr:GGDEF and EAL domain-containing protein [uncultured Cohaesibacter sp.]